jgi:hypothetical protein
MSAVATVSVLDFFHRLVWLEGSPLLRVVEPYRLRLFERFFDERDASGRPRYNLGLFGRSKKNWKSADLVLAALYALQSDSPSGAQCYLLANDEGQAGDDLELAKKLVEVNPTLLGDYLKVQKAIIERRDGGGFLQILPAQDAVGAHGKTFRFCGFDEVHGYRTWDILEAMQPDPTRLDAQTWITSYASIYHKPGVPLFDMSKAGREGADPRMLFSWYAADFTTDPAFAGLDPESRANPSRSSWPNQDYLQQQRRRLPAHKFRRLHLNLPGLPEGSAFQPDPVMNAVVRGLVARLTERHLEYRAFVDMSGGSSDDAVLAIAHLEGERAVLDRIEDQGPRPPFDPRLAVERFVDILREFGLSTVTGDRYAGETFRMDFARHGVDYALATQPRSKLYEATQPWLNGGRVLLLDVPTLEQQFLSLVWRGGKIDHPVGEHDDYANAVAGVVYELLGDAMTDGHGLLAYANEQVAQTTVVDQAAIDVDVDTDWLDADPEMRHEVCRLKGTYTVENGHCSRCGAYVSFSYL